MIWAYGLGAGLAEETIRSWGCCSSGGGRAGEAALEAGVSETLAAGGWICMVLGPTRHFCWGWMLSLPRYLLHWKACLKDPIASPGRLFA